MSTATIEPLPDRVRCAACDAEISRVLIQLAPTTTGWLLLDGFWFCEDHRIAAPYIVELDRERNAHQVTLLRLEEATRSLLLERRCGELAATMSDVHRAADLAEAATTYEAMRALIDRMWCGYLGAFHDGEMWPEGEAMFRVHLGRCERCAHALEGLMQERAIADRGKR